MKNHIEISNQLFIRVSFLVYESKKAYVKNEVFMKAIELFDTIQKRQKWY